MNARRLVRAVVPQRVRHLVRDAVPPGARRVLRIVLPPLVPLVIALALAEMAVRASWLPAYLVPAPSRVLRTLFATGHDRADLWGALGQTTLAAAAGFAISAVAGLVVAVALASAGWVQRAFYPYAVFFQTVPIIAIAPLLVIWIGYGTPTVVASAVIVSVFPVIANTLSGLLSTDPALRDLFRLYGATPTAALVKLRLPYALPNILTGLRVAAGLAVIGAIVGEFITGGGLGGVIDVSRTQQRVDKIFAGLLLSALLGIALFALINLLSRVLLRHWHASESE
jgi:NitT/TauT family transport system permease protein